MSDMSTVARPYAKAVFEYALESHALVAWSVLLENFAKASELLEVRAFIANPRATREEQTALFMALVEGPLLEKASHFVHLLAQNNRLSVLPAIFLQYERYKAEQEKTIAAEVLTFEPLSDSQLNQLKAVLTKRLKREVSIEVKVDQSLIGGAIIQAGDLKIDGSVKEQLNKLRATVVA